MYVYIFAFIHYPLGNTPIAVCHFLLLVLCIGNVAHGDAPTSWAQAARQCSHTAYHIHSNDTRVRTCIQQRAPTIHAPKRAHTLWSAIHARVSKCLALHARVSRLVHASKPHRSAPRWRRARIETPPQRCMLASRAHIDTPPHSLHHSGRAAPTQHSHTPRRAHFCPPGQRRHPPSPAVPQSPRAAPSYKDRPRALTSMPKRALVVAAMAQLVVALVS